MMESKKTVGIIPAYKPDFKLTETLRKVIDSDFLERVIVVDDGSGDEYRDIFAEISAFGKVDILHLGVNSGTGGAIKAGLQHAIYHYPDCDGFVTFDADGQHAPGDIKKVVEGFMNNPDKFAIGVRDFHDPSLHIPLRSKLGNRLTETVFHIFTGIHLSDTQSGLRCYPLTVARKITQIPRNRYDFMLEALLVAADMTEYIQIPISTIYEDKNKRSHFNPVLDSLRIYAVFFRFIGSSLLSSLIDYLFFALLFLLSSRVMLSLIIARAISVTLNFILNKRKVFASGNGKTLKQAGAFTLLALALFACSYTGITVLKHYCGTNPLLSKILVEIILFFLSFLIQRFLVFSRKS